MLANATQLIRDKQIRVKEDSLYANNEYSLFNIVNYIAIYFYTLSIPITDYIHVDYTFQQRCLIEYYNTNSYKNLKKSNYKNNLN